MGESVLAQHAVGPGTLRQYQRTMLEFLKWWERQPNFLPWETLSARNELLEDALLEYMDHLFLDLTMPVHAGTHLIAAVAYHVPRLFHMGRRNLLPRVSLALQGWQRLHPNGQRMPYPMAAVYAIACKMVSLKRRDLAILTVLSADCYLRPGEALGLSTDMVIDPAPTLGPSYAHAALLTHPTAVGRSSKTGTFDDSILMDSRDRRWLGRLVCALKHARGPGRPLVETTLVEWSRVFKMCAKELEIPEAPLYVLRHTGPSDDFLRSRRTLTQIRRRGRWASEVTMRRYEKAARTLHEANQLPMRVQRHLRLCELSIQAVLEGRATPPSWESRMIGVLSQRKQ